MLKESVLQERDIHPERYSKVTLYMTGQNQGVAAGKGNPIDDRFVGVPSGHKDSWLPSSLHAVELKETQYRSEYATRASIHQKPSSLGLKVLSCQGQGLF